ncbi:MAG TPA: hypothetical protein PLU30_18215 [Verrucomicrobiae bacterium]|nr:hypothetical protein [Verrucomicrobiae bacterium]
MRATGHWLGAQASNATAVLVRHCREGAADFAAMLRGPAARRMLWLCAPALVLGIILRVTLMAQMPCAFINDDTRTIMSTVEEFVEKGRFETSPKKVFLAPFLYSVPVFLHQPALPWIAAGQHVLGLFAVLAFGALCSLWFRCPAVWIAPLTLFGALNPDFLWYEHLALPESMFLCFSLWTAVCGTLYFRRPTPARFALFWLALFLTAGSRPEGKLFCGFGIALAALAPACGWLSRLRRGAVAILLTVWIFSITRTSQSGLLLFTSVIHFSPDHFVTAPGLEDDIREIRDRLAVEWRVRPSDMVKVRRQISRAAEAYLAKHPPEPGKRHKDVINTLCKRAGIETVLRSPFRAMAMGFNKFCYTLRIPAAESFGKPWIRDEHMNIFYEPDGAKKDSMEYVVSLTGRNFANQEEFRAWLESAYRPFDPDWPTAARNAFHRAMIHLRLPDREQDVIGFPLLHLAAIAGAMLLIVVSRGERWLHLSWAAALFGLLAIVFVTANVKARFRFAFEPWWVIYACALVDLVASRAWGLWAKARGTAGGAGG